MKNWLKEWLAETEMVCVNPKKNPDCEKIKTYCRRTENGNGCPNLVPMSALENKPGVVFGKRDLKIKGLNFLTEER